MTKNPKPQPINPVQQAFVRAWEKIRAEWNANVKQDPHKRNDLKAMRKWLDELATKSEGTNSSATMVKRLLDEYMELRGEEDARSDYVACFSIWLTYIRKYRTRH